MDGLISCLSGGGGDGLVSGLSLPLVALVHGSGTPARVLRALLLNDSMIDVSNRGALYLKALQVKPLPCFKMVAVRASGNRVTPSFVKRWSFIGRFLHEGVFVYVSLALVALIERGAEQGLLSSTHLPLLLPVCRITYMKLKNVASCFRLPAKSLTSS